MENQLKSKGNMVSPNSHCKGVDLKVSKVKLVLRLRICERCELLGLNQCWEY
jgi:hypothetical protein